jgi:CRP/FNR family cyclic AMP-dependent transcriptional regulator
MKTGLETLETSEVLRLAGACTKVAVARGDMVIEKDSPAGELFIVADGSFKVYDDSLGEDFVFAILERGNIFGEMSFLDGSPRSAYVKALTDGSLLRMGRREFDSLLAESPVTASRFLFALAGVVTGRLRQVNEALNEMTFGADETSGGMSIEDVIAQMHIAVHIELSGSPGA